MANYEQLQNDYPELVTEYPALANMFYELARGLQGAQALGMVNTLPASLGKDVAYVASFHGAGPEVIAAGLRMVADAIDPPRVSPTLKEIANIKEIAAATLVRLGAPPITSEEEAWIDRNMGGFDEKYVAALVETKARIDAKEQAAADLIKMMEIPKRNAS